MKWRANLRKRVINAARGSRGQSWFTKDIVDLRKALHGAERKWFRCGDTEIKKEKEECMLSNKGCIGK